MKEPFERIAIDMVGPFPYSHKGYQYVLVIRDYATRYPEDILLRSTDAHRVAEEFIVFFPEWGYLVKYFLTKGLISCPFC